MLQTDKEKTAANLLLLGDLLESLIDSEKVLDQTDYLNDLRHPKLGYNHENWCGASACSLGWASTHPEMPALLEHVEKKYIDFQEYEKHYFPHCVFSQVFASDLSDDFQEAAQRCRATAASLLS